MLKPFAKRISAALKRAREFDPEYEYLSEAMDLIDLERRQREIDHGLFRRRPYSF
jgi:hypothetical protein